MSRELTSRSTLENLKREAKRWLTALRAHDAAARSRFEQHHPQPPADPALRDVQHALAREHGFAGWSELKQQVEALQRSGTGARSHAITELLEACVRGDAERARVLLDEYPDIIDERAVIPGHTGARTALHHAIAHEPVVQLLLERGANPNIRDDGDNAMPLHFAAEQGNMAIVRLLVEHGADTVGAGTGHLLNVLGWAVCWDYAHNLEVAQYLLAHGAQHTIHTAVALGDVDEIRRHAADIEAVMDHTNRYRRPIHLAVIKKQLPALRALLDLGADMTATEASGLTALDQAALDDAAEMVQLLLDRGALLTLPAAIALNRTADVERLLAADPNALKPGGSCATLIVRASERGAVDAIRALIRAGASVNAPDTTLTAVDDTRGYTPLHAAAWNGRLEAVDVLLEHGANPNARDSKYCGTPAGWANYAGHMEVRDRILQSRIDVFQAIDLDAIDRIAALLQQEPWQLSDRYAQYHKCTDGDEHGHPLPWHTALAWAVVSNKPAAVRVLLAHGALQRGAPDGRSLQQIAAEEGHAEVADLLQANRRIEDTHEGRVLWFIKHACPDHDIRGPWHHEMARHTARRLLEQHPELAHDSFCTAIVCGDIDAVRRVLAESPVAAREKTGPKGWEPLLYLCFTRLPHLDAVTRNAVDIARLLLRHGADPNVHFMAGDSLYTPLTGVIGEGEEERPGHPRREELVQLLLENGAEPYDVQVLYNIHFRGDVLWFLRLIHEHSRKIGRGADWQEPLWTMLDMGGYGQGARYWLEIAIQHDDATLAQWLLEHGASPNAPPADDPRMPKVSLYEAAVQTGRARIAELLLEHGAERVPVRVDADNELTAAAMRLDRDEAARLIAAHSELLQSPKAVFAAARQDRADVMAMLLDLGFSTEVEEASKARPLHEAASHNALNAARLLLERGAEIDPVETNYGNTPLAGAVHYHHVPMIDLLGRYSSDVWQLTYAGKVARVREVLRAHPELARTITDANETLLMWLPDDEDAALALVELYVGHGADPLIRDNAGMSAADYASRRGMARVASLLHGYEQKVLK
jgi:ankyrin repeat protein